MDPRRQIYFYYLAMIRRGGEQGIPRQPSQTPSEYAAHLEKELPDAVQDIELDHGCIHRGRATADGR